jgi:hypothetical protein
MMLLKKRGKQVAGFLLAQGSGWQTNPTYVVEDVPTIYGLEAIVANILNIIISLAGVVLLLMLIMGGFGYITSGGDKEKAAKAKNTLTYAILGLLVILGAWLIIRLIEEFTGLNLHIFQIPKI